MADQLTRIPVLRFPLSRNPSADFMNEKAGRVFPNRPVSGTDLYICTHSDNGEKVRRLQECAARLFPAAGDAIEVSLRG